MPNRASDSSLSSRRGFLRTAPVAAAAVALADPALFGASAVAQAAPVPFQLFTGQQLALDQQALQAKPGNNNLVDMKSCLVVMTTEVAHSAKEFEWHEGRDHLVYVLAGSTVYEIGGIPKNGRVTKPFEHLAPESSGATTLTLKPGDLLTIPRNTPHKRSTADTVTFILISPQNVV